ncbi:MAG: hypothetical protein KC561_12550, partial [Myxococcales bacterium]|nr:hypothetical protein [Myxococcales bacterium]
ASAPALDRAVSVDCDPGLESGIGSVQWDEQGNRLTLTPIVASGEWATPLVTNQSPVGGALSARSASIDEHPTACPSNVVLLPGDTPLLDMEAGLSRGFLVDAPTRCVFNPVTRRLRLECQVGWELFRGERHRMYRDLALEVDLDIAWNSVVALGSVVDGRLWSRQFPATLTPTTSAIPVGVWTAPVCLPNIRVAGVGA